MPLKKFKTLQIKLVLFYLGTCLLAACGTPKDTAMSRGMQNLTARYNYIYNANLILDNYQEDLYYNYKDNYNAILPVYTDPEKFSSSSVLNPPANERALDAIIKKAQTIIADKAFSNYIDDAYILIGKAHFLKGNYFISEEYFDYTAKTYPAKPDVLNTASNWKARSLMQMDELDKAALILDTVYNTIPMMKKNKGEPYATVGQMYIYQERYSEAITLLQSAIKATNLKRNRIRWTYILAQLYEEQKNYKQALINYTKVEKSNAEFELYFNAELNRIKITGLLNGEKLNRKKQLLALLKDDKNLEYHDQVYFQVAESYAEDGNFKEAEKYYKMSVRKSQINNFQKGISYLKLADLNFNQFKDFLKAKLYYDSTVNTLPKTYPGYQLILKKSDNLEYISSRYDAISFEDTLQMLAKLPENDRLLKIKKLTAKPVIAVAQGPEFRINPYPDMVRNNQKQEVTSNFYFSNLTAVSRGYSDFQIKWGNRKQGDNWRQSVKSSDQTTTEEIVKVEDGTSQQNKHNMLKEAAADTSGKAYLSAIPSTPALLAASNQKIIDTYYEIASFYQQELDDPQEAAKIYQLILKRFPENNRLASIYYSLYRSLQKTDPENAEKYKNLVLTKFPESPFAKTISDPQYSAKQSVIEAAVFKNYNEIFAQYEQKAFPVVITQVNQSIKQYPSHLVNPQLSYLKAIAIGRTQPIDSLVAAFKVITASYPDDKLVVPLVNEHLAYIAGHRGEFTNRRVALPDFDPAEPKFFTAQQETVSKPALEKPAQMAAVPIPVVAKPTPKPVAEPVKQPVIQPAVQPVVKPVIETAVPPLAVNQSPVKKTESVAKPPVKKADTIVKSPVTTALPAVAATLPPVKKADTIVKPPVTTALPAVAVIPPPAVEAAITPEKTAPAPVILAKGPQIFSTDVSKVYYYVIDVADASLTLSSSRFGIGQFNRGNYAESNLKHQLTEFDNDQLIYVGNFLSFAEAKSYADGITPQLKQIMKVPAGTYSSFIISKENFEKLRNKDLVTKYLDFYKNNY